MMRLFCRLLGHRQRWTKWNAVGECDPKTAKVVYARHYSCQRCGMEFSSQRVESEFRPLDMVELRYSNFEKLNKQMLENNGLIG